MWELDYKESWVPTNWCFWTVVLEKTLESPLDCKEIKPVHPKGNQPWIFIGRTDAEAETPILWPPDGKNWLIVKDPDAGKDWRWEEKGMTENMMVGWHYWLDEHEFEQAPGGGKGQGSLTCCSPWGCKESDMTEQQPNSEKPLWGGKKGGGGREHRSSWEKLWFLGQSLRLSKECHKEGISKLSPFPPSLWPPTRTSWLPIPHELEGKGAPLR